MDFLREALRDPRNVGAIAPSSRRLARLAAERAELGGAGIVVELGPGNGAFTGEILDRMDSDALYVGIEINGAFVEALRKDYPDARFVHASAAAIGAVLQEVGMGTCDRVVSGIPWSNLGEDEQDAILGAVTEAMTPDALFLTFAYYPLHRLPGGRSTRRALERHFGLVERSEVVYGNLPPAFVYVCRK